MMKRERYHREKEIARGCPGAVDLILLDSFLCKEEHCWMHDVYLNVFKNGLTLEETANRLEVNAKDLIHDEKTVAMLIRYIFRR